MSRLDYVTIGIVAICIFAIVFLVVKTSRLMNNKEMGTEANRVEDALTNRESSVEDLYSDLEVDTSYQSYDESRSGAARTDEEEDNQVDPFDPVEDKEYREEKTTKAAPAPSAKERASVPPPSARQREELAARGTTSAPPAAAPKKPAAAPSTASSASTKASTKVSTPPATPATGFLVIAGSFRFKANAEEMVRKLKRLGYENAEVGTTNAGAYAVAVVDRLKDLESARILVSELEAKHKIDARVQKQ